MTGAAGLQIARGSILMSTNLARAMRIVLVAIGPLPGVLVAQKGRQPEPRFEVASVRVNKRAACVGPWDFQATHGAITAVNAPLRRIISRAFGLTDDWVSGPSWIDSQCYDIKAKASRGAPDEALMPMLQTLLRERLHLMAERESAERPIFALTVDEGGSKLQPFGERVTVPSSTNHATVLFMARHLPDLCERLGKVAGRPVVDKTGLVGDYQIELAYLPFAPADDNPSDSALEIFSAVRNQLGLRLDPRREVVAILRIHSVDKLPTEN
jgi:uncharacterized protein (TIGR03435 family)